MIKKKQFFVFAIFLLVPNVLLLSGIITTDGIIMSGDFTFPIRSENFQKYYFPLWNDLASQPNFERLPRLVMLSPFIALASAGVEVSAVLKIFVVSTYTFLTLSMYVFLESIQKYFGLKEKLGSKTEFFSILGAFAFAYNPVSLQFAGGISILFSVGALPLLLYIILTKINNRYFPLFVAGAFLLSLGHPFTFLMNSTIGLLFLFVVHWRRHSLKFVASKIGLSVITFLMLFAWYWIPYIVYPVESIELGRESNLDRSVFNTVSNNDPWDILLLERDRFLYVNTMPSNSTGMYLHYASLSILVGIAISCVLIFLKRAPKRIVFFMIGGFFLSVILAQGNRGVLGDAYYSLISSSDIGWMFRSPLKFQLYESFFISVLFGISLAILQTKIRIKFASIIVAVLVLIGVSSYGIYDMNLNSFKPISIPVEYYEINNILKERDDGYKVLYYPIYSGTKTLWSEGHAIGTFDMKSSSIPTYELSSNYNNIKEMLGATYTQTELFRTYNFYDFLSSLDIKYIVFHNDRGNAIDKENLQHLLQSYQTNLLYNNSNWYLFELKNTVSPPINAVNSLALTNEQEDVFRIARPQLAVMNPSSYDSETKLQYPESGLVKLATSDNGPEIYNVISDSDYSAFDLQHNYQKNWHKSENGFVISGSPNVTTPGYEVMISTSKTEKSWSWLYSDPINIENGDTLILTFHMKTKNTEGTHIKVQGFIESEGKWRDIAFVARGINGDSNWQYYWSVIQGTPDITKIRYIINSGNVLKESKGMATTWIDEVSIYNLKEKNDPAQMLHYDKINPTSWQAIVRAEKPFVLVLSETYDKGWSAKVVDKEIKSIMVNGAVNGFYIDKVGEYTVELQYRPQQLFNIGASISAVTLIAIIVHYIMAQKKLVITRKANA